ncbi:hypothetical protein Fmac_017282 [Flemingia macrophylla]|uniref:Mei2-like C-terminal RNA recognition motif domain-containing protein n=1 Tax=Flemingia macrophylla TaxID=520843 RepID=A0ABD1M1V7_9FABA
MPSETIDFNCFSSSLYLSEDICSSREKASLWKADNLPKCYDFDQGKKPSGNVQELSNLSDSSIVNIVTTEHESSLFSSSLSELFSRKLRLSANNALYGHSVDTVASHFEEERLFDSLEELETQIIGNLLPSDDDLLSGVTDELDHIIQDSAGDDMDELDFFSSVGGMDLGDENSSSPGQNNSDILDGTCNSSASIAGEQPYSEHPSRTTLAGRNNNSDVEDSEMKTLFEIRENPHSQDRKLTKYYDVKAAEAALHALNRDDTIRKRLRVELSQSEDSRQCMAQQIHSELEQKQSGLYLHQNSPTSFKGLQGISKSGSVDGGRIPGVESATCTPTLETAFAHGVSSSVPNPLPSLARVNSINNGCEFTESGSPCQLKIQAASASHPHALPEYHSGVANSCISPEAAANVNLKKQERIDDMQFCHVNSSGPFMEFNECVFKSSGIGSCPLPGQHYKWGNNSCQPPGTVWPNSPSYFDGLCAAPALPRLHGLPRSPSHMMTAVIPINGQHVPSVPLWNRRHTFAEESFGNMQFSGNTAPHCVDFVSYNIFPNFGGNCVDLRFLPKSLGVHFHNQRDLLFPRRNHMSNSFETHKQRARSRRNEGMTNLADKKQYELDIDRIKKGEDNRTTLMIKNIPNKYTSKMLLAAIDEHHRGTYDFVYLPIDFRNKCNVGYAFINMTSPGLIIPFYHVFNGKRWEKFNSEKVASLAYARIQGKAALIAHFENSSLMNEDKRCRPILFNTDGPNAGEQIPFPVGINIRNKVGRVRNNIHEDKVQGSLPNLGNSNPSSDGDSHSLESD